LPLQKIQNAACRNWHWITHRAAKGRSVQGKVLTSDIGYVSAHKTALNQPVIGAQALCPIIVIIRHPGARMRRGSRHTSTRWLDRLQRLQDLGHIRGCVSARLRSEELAARSEGIKLGTRDHRSHDSLIMPFSYQTDNPVTGKAFFGLNR
jgi:hypothetical protein